MKIVTIQNFNIKEVFKKIIKVYCTIEIFSRIAFFFILVRKLTKFSCNPFGDRIKYIYVCKIYVNPNRN